jgi:two-component system OmpR family response regulator
MTGDSAPTPKPHVLIVDDDWMNREMAEAFLGAEGFQVSTANSGENGLEIARHLRPDLIILDVYMSGMDGFETCRRLKSEDRTRTIPIIMVTAFDAEADITRALNEGADGFVTKPFDFQLLVARINALLP